MRRIFLLCFAAFILVGCGSPQAEDGSGNVILRLWVFTPSVERDLNPWLREWEAANPGVKVQAEQLPWDRGFEKILLALATQRPPDVCELGMTWLASFAEHGVLLNLEEELAPVRDQMTLVEACKYNGQLVAAPWMVGTRIFFYNRKIMRDAGLSPDKPPRTWDELLEMCKQIQSRTPDVRAIGLPAGDAEYVWQAFYSFLAAAEISLFSVQSGEPMLLTPEFRKVLDFYRSLRPYALIDRGDQLDRAFGVGKVAFHLSGAWNFDLFPRDYPTLDYGYGFIPAPRHMVKAGKGGGSMGGGELLVAFSGGKHHRESKNLVHDLVQKEAAVRLALPTKSILPAYKGVEQLPEFQSNPGRVFHAKVLERASAPPAVPFWEEMRKDLVMILDTALLTDASLDDLLIKANKHWEHLALDWREQ